MKKEEDIFELIDELESINASKGVISKNINYYLRNKARETGIPYHGRFELTPLCNLNCKMCYVHLGDDQFEGKGLLTAKEWIDLMQQAIDVGMLEANLTGGECLTYPWFDDVYLFLKSQGIVTTVLTNGVLLNNNRIAFFKKHTPNRIQISLYGDTEDAYEKVTERRAFSVVTNNITAAKEAGLPILISITPSKYNLDSIKGVIKLVKDIEVPYVINIGLMTPRHETGRQDGDHDITLDDYIDIFKYNRDLNNEKVVSQNVLPIEQMEYDYTESGLRCGAGRSVFTINWDGTMRPCSQMRSIFAYPRKVGVRNAWELINKEVSRYPRFKQCDECLFSEACTFCAAENEKMGSRYILNRTWCIRTWKMVESGLRKIKLQCN